MLPMEGQPPETPDSGSSRVQHLATVSHEGRFWEVHMEFEDDPSWGGASRARLRFEPADVNEGEVPVHTATIIIEPTYEEAMRRARSFPDHQLVALLRSALPDPD